MATSKSKPNIPTFPPPTPHKLGAGDVFTKLGSTVVIVSLPKGEASAECMDVTGKTKNIKRNSLETTWSKLGSVEAGKAVKGLVKVLKGSAPASAPTTTTESKPRKKKAPVNTPAPDPNHVLN